MRTIALRLAPLMTILAAAAGCSGEASEESESSQEAISELQSYWADAKRLDLGDLMRVAANFGSDNLDRHLLTADTATGAALNVNVFGLEPEATRVLPRNAQIKGLNQIVTGLAARFGENELGTRVNAVRRDHLSRTADNYYVESAFAARIGADPGWSFETGGIDEVGSVHVRLGLDAGTELVSRVIVATDNDGLPAALTTPIQAVKNMRGFVTPKSIEDVRKMKPGEAFGLRGLGKLGGNFGLGVPILVAEPTGGMLYRIVVSAGVGGIIGGQLDVQLVRLNGDEVVVDVGVERANQMSFHAAIRDGWGIKGVCDDGQSCLRRVNLGAAQVDLQRLVEKAVEKQMNKYLSAVNIEAEASRTSTRVSVSRMHFHLDRGNRAEVSRALEHALKFDLRTAQAMYNRDLGEANAPVEVEFDAVRAATTTTRSFGAELFGIDIYHRAVVQREGTFVVQTPDGVKSILWDSLHKHGGWFQQDHGFTRTGIAAQTLDARNPENFRSEANLFIQTNVGDDHLDDDMITDNVDALLLALAGPQAIDALDEYGNQLERLVQARCGQERLERCNVRLLDEPIMAQLKSDGLAAVERHIGRLPEEHKRLAREAANIRLILQSVKISSSLTGGPNTSLTVDFRLDDRALDILTSKTKAEYRAALSEYLTAVHADRRKVGESMTKDQVRAEVQQRWGTDMDRMAERFEAHARAYTNITAADRLVGRALAGKRFVSYPVGVRFTVDGGEANIYENAIIRSLSHDRAMAANYLFDQLLDRADGIDSNLWDEHRTAFPLLALIPAQNMELALDVKTDVRSDFWNSRERYQKAGFKSVALTARGAQVSTISAGMFDLNAIVNGNRL